MYYTTDLHRRSATYSAVSTAVAIYFILLAIAETMQASGKMVVTPTCSFINNDTTVVYREYRKSPHFEYFNKYDVTIENIQRI